MSIHTKQPLDGGRIGQPTEVCSAANLYCPPPSAGRRRQDDIVVTNASSPPTPPPLNFERRYDASVEDLWSLWTTKRGFESWWGPDGFRVDVRTIEPRVGGALLYDMIAVAPEQVEFMRKANLPNSHTSRGLFADIRHLESLTIVHHMDFVPGVQPYDNRSRVEFHRDGTGARMSINVDVHQDPHWTKMAALGWESQLLKVPAALAARR